MEEFKKKGYYPAGGRSQTSSAGSITYINTDSELDAQNVQDAIDEIVSHSNIYSESETVIGVYDGKPLYRKLYKGTLSADADNTQIDVIDAAFELKMVNGFIETSTGNKTYIGSYPTASTTCGVYTDYNNVVNLYYATGFRSGTYELSIEYTKTSD